MRRGYLKKFSSAIVNTGHTLDRNLARELFPSMRKESMERPFEQHMTRVGGTLVKYNGACAQVKRFDFELATPERYVKLCDEWSGAVLLNRTLLYLPNDKIKGWVLVKITQSTRYRSIEYASSERAKLAYQRNQIIWIEQACAPLDEVTASPSPSHQ